MERVQKIIAAHGLMSRRAAEEAIRTGQVTVNGVTAVLGDVADGDTDKIMIGGRLLQEKPDFVYVMLNKPRGVVSTMSDEHNRPTVAGLTASTGARVLPVGRLDMDSEGLLLMTNDSELIHTLTHPSFQVEKTYHAWTRVPSGDDLAKGLDLLGKPMVIEGVAVGAARVELLKQTEGQAMLSLVIHEGRKRQVRHMCANAGLTVVRLQRIKEGALTLGNLKSGCWRFLTPAEVKSLKSHQRKSAT